MNKSLRLITISFIYIMLLPLLVKAAPGQVTRIGEADRYATAAKVALENWISSENVVLVCGEVYADAVSGSTLAKALNAPIILTTTLSLNTSAQTAIDTLKPNNIYIVGGTGSVSQSIRNKLKEDKYNLIELGGKDRYETNIAVANELIKLGVKADNVMLVGGGGFSDALSVAPVAAAKGQILLLGNNDIISMKPVIDFIEANNSKVTVIGTNNIISDNMYKKLGGVQRINGGLDRFETNINILNRFDINLKNEKLYAVNASGSRYADALVASALAGKSSTPLVLFDDEASVATSNVLNYIKTKATRLTDLNVIGGAGAISDEVVNLINNTINSGITLEPAVDSISCNGLNGIKVVFNTEVDRNTAEFVGNYSVDGIDLTANNASATLQEDNKTILITLENPYPQHKDVILTVKNSILDKDLNKNIYKFDGKFTFSDIDIPKLNSLNVTGRNKLTLKFSVPIKMTIDDLASIKINGQSIINYGLNTSLTTFGEQCGIWSDKVELYFNSPLPIDNNILQVPNGQFNNKFYSAAGFIIKETEVNFGVNSVTDEPKITSIIGDSTGTIYITFNRAMDKGTALNISYYKINGKSLSLADLSFEPGSEDKIIEIKGVGNLLNNGANVISVTSSVKDAYGNKIGENTNVSFNIEADTIKPKVISSNMVDSQTMRIKFNKNVSNVYATNKSNYKLIDSDGIDISYKIDEIKTPNGVVGMNGNTYDIKFTKDNALTELEYTLTVANIVDTNFKPNVMEEYTTKLAGIDDVPPIVSAIVKKLDDPQKVVIFFSEAMDETSIKSSSNYYFLNGKGNNNKLPLDTEIAIGAENKSAIIKFQTSYKIGIGPDENNVIKIGVGNVKDKAGNIIAGLWYSDYISETYLGGPSLITNTVKLEYSGDDIKATIKLSAPLEALDINDFTISGEVPDSGYISGKNIILTFNDGSVDKTERNSDGTNNLNYGKYKVDVIKADGVKAQFAIVKAKAVQDDKGNSIDVGNSTDIAGRNIITAIDTIHNMNLPPRTTPNLWIANSGQGNNTVTISFDQNIDDSIAGMYDDDFIFTNARTGEKLIVTYVTVSGRNVIYHFVDGSINFGDKIYIRASEISSNINIRSQKDRNGSCIVYNPSKKDLEVSLVIAY